MFHCIQSLFPIGADIFNPPYFFMKTLFNQLTQLVNSLIVSLPCSQTINRYFFSKKKPFTKCQMPNAKCHVPSQFVAFHHHALPRSLQEGPIKRYRLILPKCHDPLLIFFLQIKYGDQK